MDHNIMKIFIDEVNRFILVILSHLLFLILFIMQVIHPFDAQANGELSLSVGDYVVVRQVHLQQIELF